MTTFKNIYLFYLSISSLIQGFDNIYALLAIDMYLWCLAILQYLWGQKDASKASSQMI